MEEEYLTQFHRARREEQRLAAAVHGLDPRAALPESGREELLKYVSYRKRSAMQLLIREGNLPGVRAMEERGWIEEAYLPEYRSLAASAREMEIWAFLYPDVRQQKGPGSNSAASPGAGYPEGAAPAPGSRAGSGGDFCGRIWALTRKKLRMKLPALSGALGALEPEEKEQVKYLAGDGFRVFYGKKELQRRFCRNPDGIVRDYMHLFLHNLYFHPVLSRGKDEELWNLACDIAVERLLDAWDVRELNKAGKDRRRFLLREAGLPEEAAGAEKIYRALERAGLPEAKRKKLADAFRADAHTFWKDYRQEQEDAAPGEGGGRRSAGQAQTEKSLRFLRKWEEIRRIWARELNEQHQRAGTQAGAGRQEVHIDGRSGYDYRNFLENFMVSGEEVELDLDSFDYITYWYSREHYDGMVLLEPLEYREIHRLREMVIAIDTSGSCSGKVVQQFLRETYHILSERENFFRKMQVHLIQCDSMIQEHVVIHSEEEFLEYMEHVTVKGLGGTDFRPVFELVDQLIEKKEIRDLGGLLYFTDGDGIYPAKKPAYDTAFVFLNDTYEKHEIPEWGIRLNLGMEFWEE